MLLFGEFSLRTEILTEMISEQVYDFFELPTNGQETIKNVFLFLAITFTSIGLLFLLIARLTRMVLKRNRYIYKLILISVDIEMEQAKALKENTPNNTI